jgi:hypothetical protein
MKKLWMMTMLCCLLTALVQRVSAQTEPGHFYIQPSFGGVYSFFSGSQTHNIYLGRFDDTSSTGNIYMDINEFYPTKLDLKGHFDFTLGIDAGYQVNKNWAFSFGIWYSCQGAKIDDQFVAPANSPSQPDVWFNLGPSLFRYDDFVCRGDIYSDFISLPFKAHYYPCNGFALFAGVEAGILIKSKYKLEIGYKAYLDRGAKLVEYYGDYQGLRNTLSLSALAGASYEYRHVVLSLSYHMGLTKTFDGSIGRIYSENSESSKTSLSNNSLQLTLGYKFEL